MATDPEVLLNVHPVLRTCVSISPSVLCHISRGLFAGERELATRVCASGVSKAVSKCYNFAMSSTVQFLAQVICILTSRTIVTPSVFLEFCSNILKPPMQESLISRDALRRVKIRQTPNKIL